MTAFYQTYSKFFVSVDCIIFGFKEGKLQLLVQKRPYNPGLGELSLIGGFIEMNESVDEAAQRILTQFTGLEEVYMNQLGAFGDIERDPGERVITIGYYALINADKFDDQTVRDNDAKWVDIEAVPKLFSDHNIIVNKARESLKRTLGDRPVDRNLLPEHFTLSQLQSLHEAILGCQLDKRNFRRTILEKSYIVNTGLIDKTGSRRGAQLFKIEEEEQENKLLSNIYY